MNRKREYIYYTLYIGIFFALVIFSLSGNVSSEETVGNSPRAVITILYGSSGMAPFTVHAHALNSELASGNILTARFEWDFGDIDGKYNKLVGWNVAHVYDNPGTYIITLKITDEKGSVLTERKRVIITADKRKKVYVSASFASGRGNGNSSDSPTNIKKALKSNTRILLKKGDRFENIDFAEIKNVVLDSYGDESEAYVRSINSSINDELDSCSL